MYVWEIVVQRVCQNGLSSGDIYILKYSVLRITALQVV